MSVKLHDYSQAAKPGEGACIIPCGLDRIEIVERRAGVFDIRAIASALKSDRVILARNAIQRDADQVMSDVAAELGLSANLEMQAAFAGVHGHRQNVSRYFMTVNRREEFAFILPHSEGSGFTNIQLASFYCHENNTDGGVSILMNYDQDSAAWQSVKELVTRIEAGSRPLTLTEKAVARNQFWAEGFPGPDDQLLEEQPSGMQGVRFLLMLAPLKRRFSSVLQREVHTYWDSVASKDLASVTECIRLMRSYDLLREPLSGPRIDYFDKAYTRALWSSGVTYPQLFKAIVVRKLEPGDLLIQNNLTWAHAASNWTPGSGTRNIIAAFA
jgi:hypothetical protein